VKSPLQVANEMAELERRLLKRYGQFLDAELLRTMISSAIQSKAMEEIDSVIGTYKADELLLAAAATAQLALDGAKASLIQEKQ
jgi:hypothetical protein